MLDMTDHNERWAHWQMLKDKLPECDILQLTRYVAKRLGRDCHGHEDEVERFLAGPAPPIATASAADDGVPTELLRGADGIGAAGAASPKTGGDSL